MCAPDHFDVVDVKNPHMREHIGAVDPTLARAQWDSLCRTFAGIGLEVALVPPVADCEDMVFTANQSFSGPRKRCILSRMHHASRRREVPAFRDWFLQRGWELAEADAPFEGGGDALWHPGRPLVWAGHGFRTDRNAHAQIAAFFEVEVVSLELVDDRFYHLDTCLCPIDGDTALCVPAAFDDPSPIHARFERVIEVDEGDAVNALACNAAAFFGSDIVIDMRAAATIATLERLGSYRVHEVDTGEFLKSGGSVFCLKHCLFD